MSFEVKVKLRQRTEVILKINGNFVNQDLKSSFLDGNIFGKIPLTNGKVENSRTILFTKKVKFIGVIYPAVNFMCITIYSVFLQYIFQ